MSEAATDLVISQDQKAFTPSQRQALVHLGVDKASESDLQVYFHYCKRTGLDPFARQIHMIGRNSYNQATKQWETKYTIQTGIDGFRLIGRRAADKAGEPISVQASEWMHEDGSWRPAWSIKWGLPVAARAVIHRGGSPFTAVAMLDEYAQRTKNGELTSMWKQRPAGQLAKCAEALAWRMAFPQDLAGMYTTDEMEQAANTDTALGFEQKKQETTTNIEQAVREAWDDAGQLERLGKMSQKLGWDKIWTDRIRARWEELTSSQNDEVVDAEVVENDTEK